MCMRVCERAKLQVVQPLGFDAPIKQLYAFVVIRRSRRCHRQHTHTYMYICMYNVRI